jgi:hypothetical protein
MFIDIDREGPAVPEPGLLSSVKLLFSKPAPAPPEDPALEEMRRVAGRNGLALRVYRTAAGYRAMVTNAAWDPAGRETQSLLEEFGADPLYIRLCRAQESFRARLTPKPWRCGAGLPYATFPFLDSQEERRFQQWESAYKAKCGPFATCTYLASLGAERVEAEFDALIRYHDSETRSAEAGLALA